MRDFSRRLRDTPLTHALGAMAEAKVPMQLTPDRGPEHGNRKARAFVAEIARLRAVGYSIDAIRSALAVSGLEVSRSCVWREVRRLREPRARQQQPEAMADRHLPREKCGPPAPPSSLLAPVTIGDQKSGKDIAEDFRRRQLLNPLLRAKDAT